MAGVASRTPDFSNVPVSVSRAGVGNTGPPTGLPQNLVEKRLHSAGVRTYLLDGDNVRHGLNRDLGFTDVIDAVPSVA